MKVQRISGKFNIVIASLALLFVSVVFSKIGYAQDDEIRVDTNLVTVPTTVIDRDGRYMTSLQKEDFQIFENGVEQEVALFESINQPFTILFLLDRSGSMSYQMGELANASSVFVKQLRADDRLIAATFADDIDELFEATKISDLRKGIKLKQRVGDRYTMVYDAVHYALEKMEKINGRKAIVLFSDGAGSGYFATAKSNLRDAEEQEALIYTVQFGTFSAEPPKNVSKKYYFQRIEEINGYMRDLAAKTGGRHYHIEEITDLAKTFGEVAGELGRQYSLGYYPKTDGKKGDRRQIKVKMRQPNLVVRARDSYIIESTKNKRK